MRHGLKEHKFLNAVVVDAVVVANGLGMLQSFPVKPLVQAQMYWPFSDWIQTPEFWQNNPDRAHMGLDVVVPEGLNVWQITPVYNMFTHLQTALLPVVEQTPPLKL